MVVTRFAPSPTGYLHVGNLRTALFNALISMRDVGTFILRIDDTDPQRSREEYVNAIREDLEWVGFGWDRLERQSARLQHYTDAADRLRASGRLYEAFETRQELELKRRARLNAGRPPVYDRAALKLSNAERERLRAERGPGVWRFLLDHERISWQDGIQGAVSIDAASVSDPVLVRGDGQFLYTLASVVDDVDMGITDVVRGADHLTNTATQQQIMVALGAAPPRFAHHSLLVGAHGGPLSKRDGTVGLRDLRRDGIEAPALASLLAKLGSSDPIELRSSLAELAAGFDLSHFSTNATRFDPALLAALSRRHLAGLGHDALAADLSALGVPVSVAPRFWAAIRDNVATRAEIADWWGICRDGATPEIAPADAEYVSSALALLPPFPFNETAWADWTARVREATGRKGRALFMPLRKALTGRESGPDMAQLMPLLQRVGGGRE